MRTGPHVQTIAVIRFREGWHLIPAGSRQQYFSCRADAVRSAVGLVQLARVAGLEARLLVHEEFGELRSVDVDELLFEHRAQAASTPPRLAALRGSASARRRVAPARPARPAPLSPSDVLAS